MSLDSEAEEEGKHLTALRLIVGEKQYAAFRTVASTAGDAADFSAQVMKEPGQGNPDGRPAPGDETTAAALELDFLALGVDLLDLYRGRLSFS